MIAPTVSEIRTRTAAPVATIVALLIVLLSISATAQSPAFSASELRDLKFGTSTSVTASVEAFTADELHDLRSAAHQQSIRAARSASTPAFTATELRDLRTEARSVPGPTFGPVAAFTETELHDLRRLAHRQSVAAEIGTLEATR